MFGEEISFRVTLDAKVTRRRIFRVRLVTNTKTETMTKMKANMKQKSKENGF